MTEFQITLPEDAASYVHAQIAQGKFASPSEVLADALEAKRAQAAKAVLAELIQQGIDSGDAVEVTDEWWNEIDAKIQAELQRRRSA